jgi:hypothetical protein
MSTCAAFCEIATSVCGTMAFADMATCMSDCATFPVAGVPLTSSSPSTGDSLECRFYHLTAAANPDVMNGKMVHCPHITKMSSQCVAEDAGGGNDAGGDAGAEGGDGG